MASTKTYNEDKVALLIGCFIFLLALGKMVGLDLLGWGLKMGMCCAPATECGPNCCARRAWNCSARNRFPTNSERLGQKFQKQRRASHRGEARLCFCTWLLRVGAACTRGIVV